MASCFGAGVRYDLHHVINREKTLSEVLLSVAPGVRILPAARAMKTLGTLNIQQQAALLECITGMDRPADVILVDASLDHPWAFRHLALPRTTP